MENKQESEEISGTSTYVYKMAIVINDDIDKSFTDSETYLKQWYKTYYPDAPKPVTKLGCGLVLLDCGKVLYTYAR